MRFRSLPIETLAAICFFSVDLSATDRRLCRVSIQELVSTRPDLVVASDQQARLADERLKSNQNLVHQYESSKHGLVAELVPSHKSMRVFSAAGRIPAGAKARVLILPGMGWTTSGAQLIHEMTRVLSDSKSEGDSPDAAFARKIHEVVGSDQVLVGSEVLSMPGQDLGPAAGNFMNIESNVEWLKSYIDIMRAETPDLPIIVVGWSAAAPFLIELTRRYPNLIDGQLILSPSTAGAAAERPLNEIANLVPIMEQFVKTRLPVIGRDDVTPFPNKEATTYFPYVISQLDPYTKDDFLRIPTLAIYSDEDSGVYPEAKVAIADAEKAAMTMPGAKLRVHRIPGLSGKEHEPFHSFNGINESTKQIDAPEGIQSYKVFYSFLNETILNHRTNQIMGRLQMRARGIAQGPLQSKVLELSLLFESKLAPRNSPDFTSFLGLLNETTLDLSLQLLRSGTWSQNSFRNFVSRISTLLPWIDEAQFTKSLERDLNLGKTLSSGELESRLRGYLLELEISSILNPDSNVSRPPIQEAFSKMRVNYIRTELRNPTMLKNTAPKGLEELYIDGAGKSSSEATTEPDEWIQEIGAIVEAKYRLVKPYGILASDTKQLAKYQALLRMGDSLNPQVKRVVVIVETEIDPVGLENVKRTAPDVSLVRLFRLPSGNPYFVQILPGNLTNKIIENPKLDEMSAEDSIFAGRLIQAQNSNLLSDPDYYKQVRERAYIIARDSNAPKEIQEALGLERSLPVTWIEETYETLNHRLTAFNLLKDEEMRKRYETILSQAGHEIRGQLLSLKIE